MGIPRLPESPGISPTPSSALEAEMVLEALARWQVTDVVTVPDWVQISVHQRFLEGPLPDVKTITCASAAVARLRARAICVAIMTSSTWLEELSPSALNVSNVPLMGGASSFGLGLALAHPDRTVIVLDGDGSLLMQVGSLATIGAAAPHTLYHFVSDNNVWFEGGANSSLPGAGLVDWQRLALAAGYRVAHSYADEQTLAEHLLRIFDHPGPALVRLEIEPATTDLWGPGNEQPEIPDSQLERMGASARRMMRELGSV